MCIIHKHCIKSKQILKKNFILYLINFNWELFTKNEQFCLGFPLESLLSDAHLNPCLFSLMLIFYLDSFDRQSSNKLLM